MTTYITYSARSGGKWVQILRVFKEEWKRGIETCYITFDTCPIEKPKPIQVWYDDYHGEVVS